MDQKTRFADQQEQTSNVNTRAETALTRALEYEGKMPEGLRRRVDEVFAKMEQENPEEIEAIVRECVQFISFAEQGYMKLNENRGVFSRIWGAVTWDTKNTHLQSNQHAINAQKASLQLIRKLSDKLLLHHHAVLQLQNQVNYMIVEENEFRKRLRVALLTAFEAIEQRFQLIESTINDVSRLAIGNRIRIQRIEQELNRHGIHLRELDDYVYSVNRRVDTLHWVLRQDDPRYRLTAQHPIQIVVDLVLQLDNLIQALHLPGDVNALSFAMLRYGIDPRETLTVEEFINQAAEFVDFDRVSGRLGLIQDVKEAKKWPDPEVSPVIKALSVISIYRSLGEVIEMQKKGSFTFLNSIGVELQRDISWLEFASELMYRMTEVRHKDRPRTSPPPSADQDEGETSEKPEPESVSDTPPIQSSAESDDPVYVYVFDVGGTKTQLGFWSTLEDQFITTDTISTEELFGNPDRFKSRLMELLTSDYGSRKIGSRDKIVFGITGVIDAATATIVDSYWLNTISSSTQYRKYQLRKHLSSVFKPESIFTVNDLTAAALGCTFLDGSLQYPSMVVSIGSGLGVGLIFSNTDGTGVEWGGEWLPDTNKALHDHLDANVAKRSEREFTDNMLRSIQFLRDVFRKKYPTSPGIHQVIVTGGLSYRLEYERLQREAEVPVLRLSREHRQLLPLYGGLKLAGLEPDWTPQVT